MNFVNEDALCNLVPFMQFKKRKIHPWRRVTFSTKGDISP